MSKKRKRNARSSGKRGRAQPLQSVVSQTPASDDHDPDAVLGSDHTANPNGNGVGSQLEQYLITRPRWNPADIIQGYSNPAHIIGTPRSGSRISNKSKPKPNEKNPPKPLTNLARDNNKGTTLRARLAAVKQARTQQPTLKPPTTKPGQDRKIALGKTPAKPENRPPHQTTSSPQPRLHQPRSAPVKTQGPPEDNFRTALSKALVAARTGFLVVALISLIVNLLFIAIPVYLFQVFDSVLTNRDITTLIIPAAIIMSALVIYALLDVTRRSALARAAIAFESTIASPLISAGVKARQRAIKSTRPVLDDLRKLRNFISSQTQLAFFDAAMAPLLIFAVYLVHPHLWLILTLAAMLAIALVVINHAATATPIARANAFHDRANGQAKAMAQNGEVLNTMGMVREGVALWARQMGQALTAHINAHNRNLIYAGLAKFLRLTTQIAMLCYGAYLALDNQLSGGMMIAAAIIGGQALKPVEQIIKGWREVVSARAGYARIDALLAASPENLERVHLPRPAGGLTVDNLTLKPLPDEKAILDAISFNLPAGQSLAIVGPTGAGKSTLARLLTGAIAPTSGTVRLDLMDIRNWDPRQLAQTLSYLPQSAQLFPATIGANIARLREDASQESIEKAARYAGVFEMISRLPQGFETPISHDSKPLSHGLRQRIALARAFFNSPRLVILDEPNANLDAAGQAALSSTLRRAKRDRITIIVITRRPSLLRIVDKVMLMKDGRIHDIGLRKDVLPKLGKQNNAPVRNGSNQPAPPPS